MKSLSHDEIKIYNSCTVSNSRERQQSECSSGQNTMMDKGEVTTKEIFEAEASSKFSDKYWRGYVLQEKCWSELVERGLSFDD